MKLFNIGLVNSGTHFGTLAGIGKLKHFTGQLPPPARANADAGSRHVEDVVDPTRQHRVRREAVARVTVGKKPRGVASAGAWFKKHNF